MIEGRYLWRRRPSEGGRPGLSQAVLIPVGFNVEPTDLRTLLKPAMLQKLEEVTDELEASCEDLGQYKCRYCGSGLSATGGYPIDEHNDGYFERFGCGNATRDGYAERICPKDPQFPKFDGFDLRMAKTKNGEWICDPKGKTAKAKLLDIGWCPGRTEEEALARVRERYDWYAGRTQNLMGFLR